MRLVTDISSASRTALRRPRWEETILPRSGGRLPISALDFVAGRYSVAGVARSPVPVSPARLDFAAADGGAKGLVVEPARTNVVTSARMTAAGWGKVGNATLANLSTPVLGIFTGMTIASGGSDWSRAISNNFNMAAGQDHAVSVWLAAGSSGKARIELFATGLDLVVQGTIGALAVTYQSGGTITGLSQTQIGAVWLVRFVVRATAAATAANLGLGPASATTGQTVIGYAMQMEAGRFATSFIDTAAAPVTRAATDPRLTLGPWFGAAGSLALTTRLAATEPAGVLSVLNGAGQSVLALDQVAGGAIRLTCGAGVVTSSATVPAGVDRTVAVGWSETGLALAVGGVVQTLAAAGPTGATSLAFAPTGAAQLVRQLWVFDRRLEDARLQGLSLA